MKRLWGMAAVLSLSAWFLVGCNGGSGSSETTMTGYLVDAEVAGADYRGSLGSGGVTAADGAFSFRAGETVTFGLGSYRLGAVDLSGAGEGSVVTPVELVKGTLQPSYSAADLRDDRVLALLRILQTADENGDPSDGIRISEATKERLSEAADDGRLGGNFDPETVGDLLERPVVSEEDASDHFEETTASMDRDRSHSSSSEDSDSDGDAGRSDNGREDDAADGHSSSTGVVGSGSSSSSDRDSHDDDGHDDDGHDAQGSSVGSVSSASAGNGSYTLLAWNDLGMHCMDGRDFSVFSILPPYNNLIAQLIKKEGSDGKHVTSGVTITYAAAGSPAGQYNTTSLYNDNHDLKTNFWDYVTALFNASPAGDVGLTGNHTPDGTARPLAYVAERNWWEASGLPITPYNDDGSKNYYPMVQVMAMDASGAVLATTEVVLPVSDEMDCRACHGSQSGNTEAMPSAGWENDADPEKDFKWNILRLHDQKYPTAVSDHQNALQSAGYAGYDTAGLYTTVRNGNPVLCATCHASNALPGTGIAGIKPLTESLHALHADVADPVSGQRLGSSGNRSACYRCHPGATTKCLRGAMGKQSNIQCQSCHGGMAAVGVHGRNGWLAEPDCQSCHQDGNRYTEAVTDQTTGTLRAALDRRFATNANTPAAGVSLYRYSTGHGEMQCSACHGSTHAIYPSSHPEDNFQSIAVQGHEGTIAECTACHDTTPRTTSGGPHGMHSVGQYWVGAHEDVAERDTAQCKACHGASYRGSALSKTFAARSFSTEWGTKNFAEGHAVSCYDCHNGPDGD